MSSSFVIFYRPPDKLVYDLQDFRKMTFVKVVVFSLHDDCEISRGTQVTVGVITAPYTGKRHIRLLCHVINYVEREGYASHGA